MLIGTMMVAGAGTTRIPAVAALNLGDFDPTQLLLVPMPWWDSHSPGRIHAATPWGGIALSAANMAMAPLAELPGWQALLAALFGRAGAAALSRRCAPVPGRGVRPPRPRVRPCTAAARWPRTSHVSAASGS